jgi:hypothetical protein
VSWLVVRRNLLPRIVVAIAVVADYSWIHCNAMGSTIVKPALASNVIVADLCHRGSEGSCDVADRQEES